MEIKKLYSLYLANPSIQTDSRKLKPGDIFFALKGPNFNGNIFAKPALKDGAVYCIIDEEVSFEDDRLVKVDDVLLVLQELAKMHREQFSIPFIAITGSNGKTTTKELIHEVLSTSFKTYTTEGNLNNHIGIPLTILKVKPDAELAVIEMGANHLKEIEGYCGYAQPTHGLITNCGKAHIEGFGGLEGVKKAKGELFEYLTQHNGTAFINTDLDYINDLSINIGRKVTYGTDNASITGTVKRNSEFLEMQITGDLSISHIVTKLVGEYNAANVLAAVAVGHYFGLSPDKIKTALENYTPSNSRSQLIQVGSNTIILDAYNANPTSMKAAIENFQKMKASQKVLMLGGMKEMGPASNEEHKLLVELIDQYEWKKVVLVGSEFDEIHHHHLSFDNALQAKDWLHRQHFENTHILIKGSRGWQMEKVLDSYTEQI